MGGYLGQGLSFIQLLSFARTERSPNLSSLFQYAVSDPCSCRSFDTHSSNLVSLFQHHLRKMLGQTSKPLRQELIFQVVSDDGIEVEIEFIDLCTRCRCKMDFHFKAFL